MPTDTLPPFARALRDALESQGMSRDDLHAKLDGMISRRSIDTYCEGLHEPPLSRAMLIGEALGWDEMTVLRMRLSK